MTNPYDNPEAYSTVRIGGALWPGYAKIEGAAIARNWKKNKATASSGATTSYEGEDLAEFTLTLRAWRPEHFEAWESLFKPLLQAAPAGDKGALDIEHPALTDIGVTSIVVTSVPALEVLDDTGEWGWKFKCLQYRAPKPAQANPNGSGRPADGAGDKPPYPDPAQGVPQDPQEKEIAELTEEFNQEAAGG